MMDYNTLLGALKSMTMFVPSWGICQSCGHEHNCASEGCAILRDTIATMEQLYKDLSDGQTGCFVCAYRKTPLNQNPCKGCNIRYGQFVNWQWRGVQKKEATP